MAPTNEKRSLSSPKQTVFRLWKDLLFSQAEMLGDWLSHTMTGIIALISSLFLLCVSLSFHYRSVSRMATVGYKTEAGIFPKCHTPAPCSSRKRLCAHLRNLPRMARKPPEEAGRKATAAGASTRGTSQGKSWDILLKPKSRTQCSGQRISSWKWAPWRGLRTTSNEAGQHRTPGLWFSPARTQTSKKWVGRRHHAEFHHWEEGIVGWPEVGKGHGI